MNALLVVDIQNDFIEGGNLEVPGGKSIISYINNLIDEYNKKHQLIIATKDWHPKGHISFASTHNKNVFESIDTDYGVQTLWPDHCVQGSKGAELVTELDKGKINQIILKGSNPKMDSYSAFFENDNKSKTNLDAYLKAHKVKNLLIVGLALDYCVGYSAVHASLLGYNVTVDLKGTKAISEESGAKMLAKFKKLKIKTKS